MTVYYINLLLILGLAWPLCIHKPSKPKVLLYLGVNFIYMWLIATARYGIGFDYYSYIMIFEKIGAMQTLEALLGSGYEIGFTLLTKLMTLFIPSTMAMYGFYEVLILLPVAWLIYRYSKEIWLSTWLYVTLTFFYTTMNFTRQSLAASVVLLSYPFLRGRKVVPYMLVILLACSFHKTAAIMLPVYFVCQIPLNKKTGAFYAGATLLAYLASPTLLNWVTNYIFTAYKGSIYLENGLPFLYVVLPFSIFGILLLLGPSWRRLDPDALMMTNLSMYSAVIWLFITRHFILERFSMPIYFFMILAIPSAIQVFRASPEEQKRHAELLGESQSVGGKGRFGKEKAAELKKLEKKLSDNMKYFWSAAVAVIIVTGIYNEIIVSWGSHKIFPYYTQVEWLPGERPTEDML